MTLRKLAETLAALPLLILVGVYRYGISPFTPASCRHTPTCSAYMVESIREWGALRGSWMGLRRLAKCHPWGTSGYDPVPKNTNPNREQSTF